MHGNHRQSPPPQTGQARKHQWAFVEVLQAMRGHGADVVEAACALALEAGTCSAAVILNHVHRLTSPPRPPEPAHVPEALRLTLEPLADCSRYDRLREVAHVA